MRQIITILWTFLFLMGCSPVLAVEANNDHEKQESTSVVTFKVRNVDGNLQEGRLLQIKDEEGQVFAEWTSTDQEKGDLPALDGEDVILPTDTKLTFSVIDHAHGIYAKPIEFILSKKNTEEFVSYELKEMTYHTLNFITTFEKEDISAEYTLYEEDQKTILKDIYGEDCIGESFDLEDGKYMYRQTNIDSKYYLDETDTQIEMKEDRNIEIEGVPVLVTFSAFSKEGFPKADGHLSLTKKDGTVVRRFHNKEDLTIQLERNTEYQLESNTPEGFYAPAVISFQTTTRKEQEDMQIKMEYSPTHCILFAVDDETQSYLDSAEWEIYDEEGKFVTSATSSTDGTVITGLVSGKQYTIQTKQSPETYFTNATTATTTFIVPDLIQEDGKKYLVPYTPYVTLNILIKEKDTNQIQTGSKFVLYQDGQIAKDIYGNEVKGDARESGNNYAVCNGNYELKIIEPSPYSYETKESFPVSLSHNDSTSFTLIGYEKKVQYRFECLNETKKKAEEGNTLQVLEQDGKTVLCEWNSTENEEGDLPDGLRLKRNHTYYLRFENVKDSFYRDSTLLKFVTPKEEPINVPTLKVSLIPYVSYMITQQTGQGFEYRLYKDEACTNVAKDVMGKDAIYTFTNSNSLQLQMEEGIYWLKQTRYQSNCWPDTNVYKVSLYQEDGLSQGMEFIGESISISILLKDEDRNPLPGAKFSLYTTQGDLIDSWISEETPYLVEKQSLYAGMECILKEESAPEGYEKVDTSIQYTIPHVKTAQPYLEIKNSKIQSTKSLEEIKKILTKEPSQEKTEEKLLENRIIYVILLILAGFMTAGIVWHKKNLKKFS